MVSAYGKDVDGVDMVDGNGYGCQCGQLLSPLPLAPETAARRFRISMTDYRLRRRHRRRAANRSLIIGRIWPPLLCLT